MQGLGRHAQRPAQRLAQLHPPHLGALQAVRQAGACDFHLGQFRHGLIMVVDPKAIGRMNKAATVAS